MAPPHQLGRKAQLVYLSQVERVAAGAGLKSCEKSRRSRTMKDAT